MKYISIDIETTGLDPATDQILSLAAVLEDTNQNVPVEELPYFYAVLGWKRISGDPYALAMNAPLIDMIAHPSRYPGENIIKPEDLRIYLFRWALKNLGTTRKITAAGKNFAGFDRPFIDALFGPDSRISFHHRVLDPGPRYFDPALDDVIPDLATCLKRAGLEPTVNHVALDDARDVIRVLRYSMGTAK